MIRIGALALVTMCLAPAAGAFELIRGTAEINRSVDEDDAGLYGPTVRGQAEFGLNNTFSTQLDLGYAGYDLLGDDVTGAVHGIYRPNSVTSFGAYLGVDDADGLSGTVYGLEGGLDLAPDLSAEAYFGGMDTSADSALLFGMELTRDLGGGLNARAGLDHATAGISGDNTRLNLGFDYAISDRSGFYAEAGTSDTNVFSLDAGDTYIGAGIKLDFGGRGRTSFGRRIGIDRLPGY